MKYYEFRGTIYIANSKDAIMRRLKINYWNSKVKKEIKKIASKSMLRKRKNNQI